MVKKWLYCFISHVCVFSHQVMSDSLRSHGPRHTRPPGPSPSPGVCPSLCPLNQWCHQTSHPPFALFSFCLQSFPTSGSFPMSQLFESCGQSIGVSASASVLPMNNQDWSPLGWTGWISLQSKSLSRVFSNIRVRKHQLFGALPSLWSNSHICTWLLERPYLWIDGHFSASFYALTQCKSILLASRPQNVW